MHAAGDARTPGVAPEDLLLLLLCRADPDRDDRVRAAALLDGPVDWAGLVESSVRHAVTPLLWAGLGRIPGARERVPAAAAAEMTELGARAVARHRRLYGVLGEIVGALDAARVPVLGLKDIDLAARLYPAPGLRPIGDLDLLIHREDHAAALAALARLGFAPPPGAGDRYGLRYGGGHHVIRAADAVWVDLQWTVAQREWDIAGEAGYRFDVDGMWRRAERVDVESVTLLVPGLEDMLLHLCLHLEGHRYAELVLLCDIDLLCGRRSGEIDWDRLAALAAAAGARGSVERPLAMVRRLLGTAIPDEVLARFAAPYVEAALHGPLFAGTAAEHSGLDELSLAARPPARLMDAAERAVRRRRRAATEVCREVGALALAACAGGAAPVVAEVATTTALVPDAGDPVAGPIRLLVTPRSEAAVRSWVGGASRRIVVRSSEPSLSGEEIGLVLRIRVDAGRGPVPPAPASDDGGNRGAALRAMRGAPRTPGDAEVDVTVVVRSPEAIVAHVASSVADAGEERLWRLDVLLQALDACEGRLDAAALDAAVAARGRSARHGLALAAALRAPLPHGAAAAGLPEGDAPLRLFEWARYGASELRRDSALRRPFWFAYAVTRACGAGERTGVLRQLVLPSRGRAPLAPGLVRDVGRGIAGVLRRRPLDTRDLAFWIEPDALMAPDRGPAGNRAQ